MIVMVSDYFDAGRRPPPSHFVRHLPRQDGGGTRKNAGKDEEGWGRMGRDGEGWGGMGRDGEIVFLYAYWKEFHLCPSPVLTGEVPEGRRGSTLHLKPNPKEPPTCHMRLTRPTTRT